jgi:hypothetical protein
MGKARIIGVNLEFLLPQPEQSAFRPGERKGTPPWDAMGACGELYNASIPP